MTDHLPQGANWYVLHCPPRKEGALAASVPARLACPVYLPLVRQRQHTKIVQAPLCPGYVFVRALPTAGWLKAVRAAGALRVLACDGAPQAVPEPVIQHIRKRVAQIEARGGLLGETFSPGEPVRLAQGPLHGLDAVFVAARTPGERARVLVDFLGQLREAEVPWAALERGGQGAAPPRRRRTRGQGRPIRAGRQTPIR